MNLAIGIVFVVFVLAIVLVVTGMFVWAAVKDGEDERAFRSRLGLRRRPPR
jgi:hypothetical protein